MSSRLQASIPVWSTMPRGARSGRPARAQAGRFAFSSRTGSGFGLQGADSAARLLTFVVAVMLVSFVPAMAQVAMPDASQMSGIPRPVDDLPAGTVTVRLIRGSLGNNISGHEVEVRVGGAVLREKTDQEGRATFSKLQTGATVRASAQIDGETLQSQDFTVPPSGGIRVMLVARAASATRSTGTEAGATEGQAPLAPVPGIVVLGGNSRIVIELGEDGLRFFYLFELVNSAKAPVQTAGPVVIELPQGAAGATILQGSTPQATANGPRVIVTGPFQPGSTNLQVGFLVPFFGGSLSVAQTLPVALPQLTLIAEKAGEMHVTSPQFSTHSDREMDGRTYVLANGPGLQPGGTITVSFENLPHHSLWPRRVALVLALGIALAGIVAAVRKPAEPDAVRIHKLVARRDRLFEQLVRIDAQIARQGTDAQKSTRRADLMSQLERVYQELDDHDIPLTVRPLPPAGPQPSLAERSV